MAWIKVVKHKTLVKKSTGLEENFNPFLTSAFQIGPFVDIKNTIIEVSLLFLPLF